MQMALDSWLLEQHRLGLHPHTLRFYTWSPIAISLGYHQRQWPDAWASLTWRHKPIDLVRRPSGGRAVLHQGDLTYAVITSGLPGSRLLAYQAICQFLLEGWRNLGVDLHYGSAGRGYIHNPNCFATATGADLLTATGKKLIGSAQLRRGQAILQHGSIQLDSDPLLFQQVFGIEPDLPQLPISTLHEAKMQQVMTALTTAAQQCFAADLVVSPLSQQEWQAVTAHAEHAATVR